MAIKLADKVFSNFQKHFLDDVTTVNEVNDSIDRELWDKDGQHFIKNSKRIPNEDDPKVPKYEADIAGNIDTLLGDIMGDTGKRVILVKR